MRFVSKTDVGRRRANNEDSIFSKIYNKDVGLFIVADGLGGYASGEIASMIVTKKISEYIEENLQMILKYSDEKIKTMLQASIILANDEIYRLEKTDEKYKGMGTTIVMLLVVKDKMFYVSVGDSRMYYIDSDFEKITQITIDDTYVNELIKTKVISKLQASTHPQKHVLTKAVGILKNIHVEVNMLDEKKGFVILCSDGITNMISEEQLLSCMKSTEFEGVADRLVNNANENGGLDNISVIVIEI